MNKEEIRHYKLFIKRTTIQSERKDELLFDYAKQNRENFDETKIAKKLYTADDKNAYYRLKNRLIEDIGKSLLSQHYKDNDLNIVVNYILLSRLFFKKGQFKLSNYYLVKAERKASEKEYVDWLDIIYTDFIKLSQETLEINPEEYITKRKANRSKLLKLQEIDDILSALVYRIKISQNYSSKNNKILELLQNTVNDFAKSKDVKSSPVLRFKIYDSVSRILLQQQNFISLEKYLVKTYAEFTKEKLFNQQNHDTKLQLLTYLINSLFKNSKIDESLAYAEKLRLAMQEHNGMLHDKYLFYYYNSLVINYSVKDIDKAIEILHDAKNNEVVKKLPMYNVFVYLNLAVLNFGKGQFKEALKNLVKPILEDVFSNLDEAFRLKLSVFELLIRFELNDFDYLERKIERIKKEHKAILRNSEYKIQLQLMSLIQKMIDSTGYSKDKALLKIVKSLLEDHQTNQETNIVNYANWLKNKFSI
jgi:hypothetical protein